MMERVEVKYRCANCGKEYDTQEEAAACWASPVGRFRAGDVVRVDHGRVKYLKFDPEPTGCSIHNDMDFQRAKWDTAEGKRESWWYTPAHFCVNRITKYPLEEAEKLVAKLRVRLKGAEKFLARVKAMHERDQCAP